MTDQFAIHSFSGTSYQLVAQRALPAMNPDQPRGGDISTHFDARVIPSDRIKYACDDCGQALECGVCSRCAEKAA